ncbi:hypothetical protein GLAREA_09181 [Glarea lozoyensis ATCC 20868]|uniref:Xylanolytic transcriptional activator regulatory domain-containing protein n=1 Tax=Glarea lozoyensis (strain ATCC 20868 / MF5171) TaxID=1116229 RepID=S3EFQ3_GLAL2|nr:uncharacterized protein GLAREA_09181 [Glarea lozoyensis ATCC 20868]EPE37018.1 hypothetical protein GLAREA_09181 [Glarea lozoyensis ATCC 20868]
MPRYGFGHYLDAREMVKRTDQLIVASQLCFPEEEVSEISMICTLLMGMSCHYTEQATRGWILINESIQCCRFLGLGERRGYTGKPPVTAEICKRAFWMLYIIQIHDRLSHLTPDTLLGQDPTMTDWIFLMPLELDDEHLPNTSRESDDIESENATAPLISGFVSLIKVFICVIGLLNEDHSQAPSPGIVSNTISSGVPPLTTLKLRNNSLQNATLDYPVILQSLKNIVFEFPQELQSYTIPEMFSNDQPSSTPQLDIMKANIHITRLYLMSSVLESSASSIPPTRDAIVAIWNERESICRQLLEVVHHCPLQTLESNGTSMVIKIREIASTLLTQPYDSEGVGVSHVVERSRAYIESFIGLLAELDVPAEMAVIAKQASTSPTLI